MFLPAPTKEILPMDRHGNVFAVTEVDCDLCEHILRLTLVDDKPQEGEVTLTSKTAVCPQCSMRVPIRVRDHHAKDNAATDS